MFQIIFARNMSSVADVEVGGGNIEVKTVYYSNDVSVYAQCQIPKSINQSSNVRCYWSKLSSQKY